MLWLLCKGFHYNDDKAEKIVDTLCIVWSCTNLRFCDALVLQIMICKQINPILKSYLKVERETVTTVLLHWSEFCFTGDAIIAPTHTFFFLAVLTSLPPQSKKCPCIPNTSAAFVQPRRQDSVSLNLNFPHHLHKRWREQSCTLLLPCSFLPDNTYTSSSSCSSPCPVWVTWKRQ